MKSFVLLIFGFITNGLLAQDFKRAEMGGLFTLIDANQQGMHGQ